jgi:hypothetical protein
MFTLENGFIAFFVLWSLASVGYELRGSRLRRWLHRFNGFGTWVRWALFNSDDVAVRPAYFEIEYRDRDAAGNASPWTVGLTSRFWSWRAGLWAPEQRLADAVQHLGRTIKTSLEKGRSSPEGLREQTAIIEGCLRRKAPRPTGTERHFRVIRRVHSVGSEIIHTFTADAHGSAR